MYFIMSSQNDFDIQLNKVRFSKSNILNSETRFTIMTRVTLPAVISGGGADRGGHHGGLQVPPPGHHTVHIRWLGDRH